MSSACASADFVSIGETKSAACGDIDAAGRTGDEASEYIGAGKHVRCASRSEDTVAACGDDVFEGAIEVKNFVERTVKGHFHWRGEFDKSACASCVYRVIPVQYPEDDTGRSKALRMLKLGADRSEVGGRIDKAIRVRA